MLGPGILYYVIMLSSHMSFVTAAFNNLIKEKSPNDSSACNFLK